MTTATPRGAREHARQQAATLVDTMPVLPASSWPEPPVDSQRLTWAETVGGGNYTSLHLARGATLRLRDLDGDACAHLLLYNAAHPAERLNVADTGKVQWQAYPTTGSLLLSDLGRALATITADTSGRHDTMCGTTTRRGNERRYGDGSPQGGSPAGRELFLLAGAKHGLDRRDLGPSVSFFQGVRVGPGGALEFLGTAGAGVLVEITAELPVLVLIANTAHPLDPRDGFACGRLEVLAWSGEVPELERSPEAARALLNTTSWLRGRAS